MELKLRSVTFRRDL